MISRSSDRPASYPLKDAAKELGISYRHLQRKIKDGAVPVTRVSESSNPKVPGAYIEAIYRGEPWPVEGE